MGKNTTILQALLRNAKIFTSYKTREEFIDRMWSQKNITKVWNAENELRKRITIYPWISETDVLISYTFNHQD